MMIFRVNTTLIEIRKEVIESLEQYRQIENYDFEAGGILQGKRLKNGNIIVTNLTTPKKIDTRSRFFFKKNSRVHQEISDKFWVESNRMTVCIGDWHTHPEEFPSPSRMDLRSWKKNLRAQKDEKYYIFVIVGLRKIELWIGSKKSKLKKAELLKV
jgi:integrative and conjugative element protein (TIGR02256 family)